MDNYVRTFSGAQIQPPLSKKTRGQKAWRYAAFSSRMFFLIEACVDQNRDIELLSFLTADVAEAYRIENSIRECRWSRVQLFMRFRDVTKQDLTYEELDSAYRSRLNGAIWYRLLSGHLITESGPAAQRLSFNEEFESIYERRGHRCSLHSLP